MVNSGSHKTRYVKFGNAERVTFRNTRRSRVVVRTSCLSVTATVLSRRGGALRRFA